jgi:hypothetical protein
MSKPDDVAKEVIDQASTDKVENGLGAHRNIETFHIPHAPFTAVTLKYRLLFPAIEHRR